MNLFSRSHRLKLNSLIFSFFAVVGCATHKPEMTAKLDLCKNFEVDLTYIHNSIKNNFVGYTHSPELRKSVNEAYLKELSLVPECQSNLDYIKSIKRYFAVFNDPHVKAIWNGAGKYGALLEASAGKKLPDVTFPIQYVSTGVFLSRMDGRFFVQDIDPNIHPTSDLKNGDELKSCAGSTPQNILENEILPFETVSAKDAALYRFAPSLFFRWDQPAGTNLQCEFEREGKVFTQTLKWNPVSEDYLTKTFRPVPSKIYNIEKTAYGHWVTLKTFGAYDEETTKQLKAFAADAKTLRKDKIIVVDVRGNGGGNSSWGSEWIDGLYGYHKDPPVSANSLFVLASAGNKAHFEALYEHLKKTGGLVAEGADLFWKKILNAVKEPTGKLEGYYEAPSKPAAQKKSGFKGKVYVLTDAGVFSSGETFVEQLKMMPQVKQAGIATNASTYYSDIRFDITPGGLAFNFPTKGFAGDPRYKRKSGEALMPEIPLSQDPKLEFAGKDSMRMKLEKMLL